jgi:hypothetical protein
MDTEPLVADSLAPDAMRTEPAFAFEEPDTILKFPDESLSDVPVLARKAPLSPVSPP